VLVAGAVCPHPPLLVPEAMGAGGIWQEADAGIRELRSACRQAVAVLADAQPDLIAVVGGADRTAVYRESAAGSMQSLGIPFVTGVGEPVLPLSLAIGAWLVRDLPPPRRAGARSWGLLLQAVDRSLPPAECLRLGRQLARQAPRVALLAMGDGPARRATGVPGAADPLADDYDTEVAAALAAADPGRLARLDPALDADLMVAGRAAWQVLAGAAEGGRLRGRLQYAAAPLDVTYLVATWGPDRSTGQDGRSTGQDGRSAGDDGQRRQEVR